MASWISKASKKFRRPAVEQPQPFRITCACRNELKGMREASYQTLRCGQCGNSLFVLPRNPYPPLKSELQAQKAAGKARLDPPAFTAKSRTADSEQADISEPSARVPKTRTREALEITDFL